MAKSAFCFISIIIGIVLIFNPGNLFSSEKPEVLIFLKFNKKTYKYGEPIKAKVMVSNKYNKNLLLSRGFSKLDALLEMRIIDPAGQLVIARQLKPHNEFPDTPPLPYVLYDKEPVRAVPCEDLKVGAKWTEASEDIRDYYALERLGKYSAQVQISVAIFRGEPCNIKNYKWLGVLKSNTVEFCIEPVDEKKQTAEHQSPDRNFDWQFASTEPLVLKASNHNSYTIKLAAGGGREIPTADMTEPVPTIDVPANTSVKVDLENADSKVVVIMNVSGTEVYNTLAPDPTIAYPHTQRYNADSSTFSLIYQDPQTDYAHCQQVDVEVIAYKKKRPNTRYNYNFNFQTICPVANDSDGDGISDETETKTLHTNPQVKTLFVRPKMLQGMQFVYWPKFIALFPDARAGFADIPAFTDAGIEISVIGDKGHPYVPMQNFAYDPGGDTNHPACDILEIFHMPDGLYCTFGHHNFGHTYFYSLGSTWYWDTKGYVPNDQISAHYQKYQYFTPLIYPFPLDKYFEEGAYDRIAAGEGPEVTAGCGLNQCYDYNNSSPLNINSGNPVQGRPDDKVDFNPITFNSADRKITFVGNIPGAQYDKDTVLRRTLVHEMGHALLAASELDHCNDPQCIMYGYIEDWAPRGFGPPEDSGNECTHSPGGSKDIRAPGVIHNRVH
jgi:hypothetical protein